MKLIVISSALLNKASVRAGLNALYMYQLNAALNLHSGILFTKFL